MKNAPARKDKKSSKRKKSRAPSLVLLIPKLLVRRLVLSALAFPSAPCCAVPKATGTSVSRLSCGFGEKRVSKMYFCHYRR